jgi:glycerol-3-phosphate dehydrogenase (NAD(P)+)
MGGGTSILDRQTGMTTRISILGSGAMATACSVLLSEQSDQDVRMWVRSAGHARDMAEQRENRRLLPGVPIPPGVLITADVDEAVHEAEFLVAAIPTKFLRSALEGIAPFLGDNRPVVSVIKGLENETFMRPSEIIADVLGSRAVVALCGPSHAEEISRRLPASVVAASGDVALARRVQEMFSTERFRVYTNPDIIGVELAGALKNIIAIAAGICDGLGFGDNAKSALLTRGLVEMTRFGMALGAEALTFSGLAGIGDLITTCISPYSRNRMVGERLGRGESLAEILESMDAVAEGVTTAESVHGLAEQKGIEMPITAEVFAVLFEDKPPVEATASLMLRPPRGE